MNEKRIAYWMSEKKIQKYNWSEFEATCNKYGFSLFKWDLNEPLSNQGTFCVFLHKLTDYIALAEQGDLQTKQLLKKVEDELASRNIIVLDPISSVRKLLNRYTSYRILNESALNEFGIFTPKFTRLESLHDVRIKLCNVSFPFVAKACLGHGSKRAHQMALVFNAAGFEKCAFPCVAQQFINHNAILYKIFIVGGRIQVVERPSITNFSNNLDFTNYETIRFDSGDISKMGSCSSLTQKPKNWVKNAEIKREKVDKIVEIVRKEFKMDLLGVDVVIEDETGRYGIIDVNVFPGYDGYPDFYDTLLQLISEKVNQL